LGKEGCRNEVQSHNRKFLKGSTKYWEKWEATEGEKRGSRWSTINPKSRVTEKNHQEGSCEFHLRKTERREREKTPNKGGSPKEKGKVIPGRREDLRGRAGSTELIRKNLNKK